MRGYIYWDAQDPQHAGWSLAYLGEDSPFPLAADNPDDPDEARQEATRCISGLDLDDIGEASDDREANDLHQQLEAI